MAEQTTPAGLSLSPAEAIEAAFRHGYARGHAHGEDGEPFRPHETAAAYVANPPFAVRHLMGDPASHPASVLEESVAAAEEEYREIEAELDRLGIPRAHVLTRHKTTLQRLYEDSASDVVNRIRALAAERDGWEWIARSNEAAYNTVLAGLAPPDGGVHTAPCAVSASRCAPRPPPALRSLR